MLRGFGMDGRAEEGASVTRHLPCRVTQLIPRYTNHAARFGHPLVPREKILSFASRDGRYSMP